MNLLKTLFTILVMLLTLSCSTNNQTQPKQEPWKLPSTKEACLKENGKWGQYGLIKRLSCRVTTDDFNKTCTDSSECKGVCFTKNSSDTLGNCSKHIPKFGCFHLLKKGKTVHLCAD